ncbi:hypothetical protein RF55_19461, partial [Lasius niger]
MLRVEVLIERISAEISDKVASLLELDAAANSALANFVSHQHEDNNWQDTKWAERAHRRDEAGRSREGSTRISGQSMTKAMRMDKENEKQLPPQGFRTPSGRRESSMVPGALSSSSSEGPAPSLPTGEERQMVTVANEDTRKVEKEEPLKMATIDCATFSQEFGDSQDVGLVVPVVRHE